MCTIVGPLGTVISSELKAPTRFVLVAFLRLRGSFDSSMVGRSGSRRGLLERLRRVGEAFKKRERRGGRRKEERKKNERMGRWRRERQLWWKTENKDIVHSPVGVS